jgi:hypothetical protein
MKFKTLINSKVKISASFFCLLLVCIVQCTYAQKHMKKGQHLKTITSINGLVALWDFKEASGTKRIDYGKGKFPLEEQNGVIERIAEGPLSGYSSLFKDSAYFKLPNDKTGALNIYGKKQGVSVVAWVKWSGGTGFLR